MAITINIYYTGQNGSARRFAGDGLQRYGGPDPRRGGQPPAMIISSPMDDPETVLLIDSWPDQNALDVHHASPMMGKIASPCGTSTTST